MESPKKIAILGGGVGAIVAAYALTNEKSWQSKYEITLYQTGWRLGGKGASGRNKSVHARIEEHGLHVWFGFYENAFRVMRECYAEYLNDEYAWEHAFSRQDFVMLEERVADQWVHFPLHFPRNNDLPGERNVLPLDMSDYVSMALAQLRAVLEDPAYTHITRTLQLPMPLARGTLGQIFSPLFSRLGLSTPGSVLSIPEALEKLLSKIPIIGPRASRLTRQYSLFRNATLLLLAQMRSDVEQAVEDELEHDDAARRLWASVDIATAIITGMFKDGVLVNGFDAINDYNFRDWLLKHGATEQSVESAYVRSLYNMAFAFADGDKEQPSSEAGTTLRCLFRLLFTYRGSFMWKMEGGMGDVVFTPFYEVLRKRGVKFEFFHRVRKLRLSEDKQSICAIEIGRQARAKNGTYEPLTRIGEQLTWPTEPHYDQLEEGETLRHLAQDPNANGNLESVWSSWSAQNETELTLERGIDFDDVVLGISLGPLAEICSELVEADDAWKNMLAKVRTCRTQAFQVWLKSSIQEMGWTWPRTIAASYVDPIDTWADMTHTGRFEAWPADMKPGMIGYFCGPMTESDHPEPEWFTDPGFPARETERAFETLRTYADEHWAYLWPQAVVNGKLDRDLLIGPDTQPDEDRLRSQYWVANVDPSTRYVLSVPGSTKYRLESGQSGFRNLYLVGDWTRNGINAGCVEAATISGLQAVRALSGCSEFIVGEKDFV